MNKGSKFIQSLVALAAAVPLAAAIAAASPVPAAAASAESSRSVDFASNLSAKLNTMAPIDPVMFGEVWVRTDFVEVQTSRVPPAAVTLSAVEAFELVSRA